MQRHALFDHIFELLGVKNTQAFMMSPNSPEFQQMQMQKQVQMEQQSQEAMVSNELQKQLMVAQATNLEMTGQAALQKVQVDQADKFFDNTLNEEELDHTKLVDLEKLAIEREKINASG